MRGMQKFLFYYATLVTLILQVASFFYLPSPQNFIISALFLPVTGFFWISFSSPKEVDSGAWSVRVLIIIILFAALGTNGFWLVNILGKSQPKEISILEKITSDLKSSLEASEESQKSAQKLAESLEFKSKSQTLGEFDESTPISTPSPTPAPTSQPVGFVIPATPGGEVYESPIKTSKVLAKIVLSESYPFYKFSSGWYQISLTNGDKGWIEAVYVKEVN